MESPYGNRSPYRAAICCAALVVCIALIELGLDCASGQVGPSSAPPAPASPFPASAPQSPAPASTPAAEAGGIGKPEEAGPVLYIRGPNGKLFPVLEMTFEQYDRWVARRGVGGEAVAPSFAFTKLAMEGHASDRRFEIELAIEGRLAKDADKFVRVPIGLGNAFLLEDVQYEGPGEFEVEYQGDAGAGYVLWLQGKADTHHTWRMKFAAPVRRTGEQRSAKMRLPTFPLHMELTAAMPDAEIEVIEPAVRLLEETTTDGNETRTAVDCNGGDIEVRWGPRRVAVDAVPTVLEASCATVIRVERDRIDGRRRIRGEANMRVSSFGGPIDSFEVRMPPGMDYVLTANPSFSITSLPDDGTAQAEAGGLLRVEWLGSPTNGPIDLRLLGEVSKGTTGTAPISAAGFHVIGATRQWGTIEFQADESYGVEWPERKNIRRIRETPSTGTLKNVGRFEYDRTSYSLTYRVTAQPARVSVDPTYVLFVRDKQVVLDATLNYTIQGNVTDLKLDLAGWALDGIEPAASIAFDRTEAAAGEQLVLNLKAEALATPPLVLKMKMSRPITSSNLALPLPRPLENVPNPAVVAVVAADNIELTPRTDEIVGLAVDPAPPELPLPRTHQPTLHYRERSGESVALQWAASHRVRDRLVSVALESAVTLLPARVDVYQTLSYRIDYEPVSHLKLLAPRAAAMDRALSIVLDDETLPYRMAEEIGDTSSPGPLAPIVVDLLQPRADEQELRIRYSLAMPDGDVNHAVDWEVPLAVPEADSETTVVGHHSTVDASPSVQFRLREGAWRPALHDSGVRLATDAWQASIPFEVARLSGDAAARPILRRAWVQTWLAADDRRDRAVFRVQTTGGALRVVLPKGVDQSGTLALLDGERPKVFSAADDGVVLVGVPEGIRREVVLELWYRFPGGRPPIGRFSIDMPRIEARDQCEQFYWQLLVPGREHLLAAPGEMSSVEQWRWNGWFWDRRAILGTKQLESWIGAAQQSSDALAASDANAYLFSSLSVVKETRAATADRSWLVLLSSGAALVLGLALIRFAGIRRPAVLLAIAVLVAAAALWRPEAATFAAQGAIFGVLLAVFALWLDSAVGRRSMTQRQSARHASWIVRDAKSLDGEVRRPEGSSRGERTTESALGALHLSQARPQL